MTWYGNALAKLEKATIFQINHIECVFICTSVELEWIERVVCSEMNRFGPFCTYIFHIPIPLCKLYTPFGVGGAFWNIANWKIVLEQLYVFLSFPPSKYVLAIHMRVFPLILRQIVPVTSPGERQISMRFIVWNQIRLFNCCRLILPGVRKMDCRGWSFKVQVRNRRYWRSVRNGKKRRLF